MPDRLGGSVSDRYARYSYLDVVVDDRIAMITIDRPETRNRCEPEDHTEFSTILRDINADPDVDVAVITANGPDFYIGGGASFLDLYHSPPEAMAIMGEIREIVQSHIECEKPVVCAINGVAKGGGATFALLCDYIILERTALLSDGHIRSALAAGDGGTMVWPLSIGLTVAKKYLLTGDNISAEDAERFGLVTEVVEEGQGRARAIAVGRRLAGGPQTAMRKTKVALNQWLRLGQTTSHEYALGMQMLTGIHPDVLVASENAKNGGPGAIGQDV
jgi:enoyl-CoA hydratase